MRREFVAVLAVLVVSLGALAQNTVKANQGAPGTQGPWPVTITSSNSDGGTTASNIAVYPRTCTAASVNTNTVIGATAGNVPATANTARIYAVVCNSAQNASTAIIKCRSDGASPVFAAGNAGDVLLFGDCVTYAAAGTNAIQCIGSGPGLNVTSYECIP